MFHIGISLSAVAQTTDFTYASEDNRFCAGKTIQFTQNSSGRPKGYLWSFGNGTYSNVANPEVDYTEPGTYTIRLIAVYDNNTAEKIRTITIHPNVSAFFSVDRDRVCTPSRISFNATNYQGVNNYEWNFGDTSPVVSSANTSAIHYYSSFGDYTATLTCTNNFGCEATYSRQISVSRPVINSTLTNPGGCIPVTSHFTASVSLPPGSTVSNYSWNFGDGTNASSASAQTNHLYNSPGDYLPTLSITTNDGCSSSFVFDSVHYGFPPTNLRANPLIPVFCGSEAGQFIATATNADKYSWNFGGSGFIHTTDTFIEHKFSSLGIKNVTVIPSFNNCPAPPVSMQVEVIGVIAGFSYRNTCDDKKTFSFTNTSDGNLSTILWRFGDQTPTVALRDPVHSFPISGAFRTRLFVEDYITGCKDSTSARILTAEPKLNNPDSSICIHANSLFRILDNYANPNANYLWNVLGSIVGPTSESQVNIQADSLGNFSNSVIINNGPSYCPDTLNLDHPITVKGPMLDFNVPASICLDVPLIATNLSHPFQPADTIKSWRWDFGRNTINDTAYQPAPYQYTSHKTYPVKLVAIDKSGCKDSLIKYVAVRPMPFLWIIPRIDTLCLGQRDSVIAYTNDEVLWTASVAGPAFCTNCDSTAVNPIQTTRYFATATNSFSCAVSDSMLVKVYHPFTAVSAKTFVSVCENEKIQLDIQPANKKITWSPPGGLSNTSIHNPIASPAQSTLYTAHLSDSVGCFDSQADIQIIVNPKPTVEAGPSRSFPYYTHFTISPNYSSNVRQYEWSPSDSLSCRNCPSPSGIATRLKTYMIKVTSDSGCVTTDHISIAVECKNAYILMPTAFTPNRDFLNDFYQPVTRGIQAIKRFTVFNRAGQVVSDMQNFVPNKNKYGWDGKYRGTDQPGGTYVYILEALCETGQTISKNGSFILIR